MSSASPLAHLADDETVGPHAQRGADELAHRHRARRPSALGGRASSRTTCGCASRSSAVSSMVTTRSACGIDARQRVQQRGLPRARRPRHEDVPSRADRPREERRCLATEAELAELDGPGAEPADGHARTVDRERRDHRVQTRAVGRAGRRPSATTGRGADRAARRRARRGARWPRRRDRARPARAGRDARRRRGRAR